MSIADKNDNKYIRTPAGLIKILQNIPEGNKKIYSKYSRELLLNKNTIPLEIWNGYIQDIVDLANNILYTRMDEVSDLNGRYIAYDIEFFRGYICQKYHTDIPGEIKYSTKAFEVNERILRRLLSTLVDRASDVIRNKVIRCGSIKNMDCNRHILVDYMNKVYSEIEDLEKIIKRGAYNNGELNNEGLISRLRSLSNISPNIELKKLLFGLSHILSCVNNEKTNNEYVYLKGSPNKAEVLGLIGYIKCDANGRKYVEGSFWYTQMCKSIDKVKSILSDMNKANMQGKSVVDSEIYHEIK